MPQHRDSRPEPDVANRRPPPDGRDDYHVDESDNDRFARGVVQPEAPEDTPEARDGLADEIGIEIDNAIERPRD